MSSLSWLWGVNHIMGAVHTAENTYGSIRLWSTFTNNVPNHRL